MKTTEKTILITGGGSGIGLAIALEMLKHNNKVIVCGRNLNKLELVKEKHPDLKIAQCDVTDDHQILKLVDRCNKEFGGIDILINNAGVFQSINYMEGNVPFEAQAKEVDIDMLGPIRTVHHFLPHLLKKSEAAIVNVSSGLAFIGLAMAPVYCATKAGIHSWTQSLRYQLKDSTVEVFELMPPLVETEMVAGFEGAKMMKPERLANDFYKALSKGVKEITPGQSSQLRLMRRLAPGFIFNALNKQFS